MKKTEKQILSLDERMKKLENSSSNPEGKTEKGNNKLITEFLLKAFLPIFSMLISIFAIYLTEKNNKRNLEYIKTNTELSEKNFEIINNTYKENRNPVLDIKTKIYIQKNEDEAIPTGNSSITILNRNNLENIYLILPSNYVIPINVNNKAEITLDEVIKNSNVDEKDFIVKHKEFYYKYAFILSKSIFEDIDIYLFYSKSSSIRDKNDIAEIGVNFLSEEEVYMLENYDKDNPEREGERQIAKQYKEIIKWYKNNLMN
ncbi:hypothetical protein ABGF48_08415 [Helcococcus bovis]|uniref:hypothetical protein n=1 Tax=Helcococcus bovis TaxID=3153252 RepID=UPI0038BDA52B